MDGAGELRRRLEEAVRKHRLRRVRRVVVVEETPSTQDSARIFAGGEPGLVVAAERQTGGRGRLGRVWTHTQDLGIAMTFVLDAHAQRFSVLSLGCGLAAAMTVEGALGASPEEKRIGLRWPNDVVERERGRKLAGVLIEAADGLALAGIGINVEQQKADWPEALRGKAVSVRELGSAASRADVAERLLLDVDRVLEMDEKTLVEEWTKREVLVGTEAEFFHAGKRVRGMVESIAPTHEIVVRTAEGVIERLPAATTSLIHR